MPDEPLYDPDKMAFEDLDFTNPDVAAAYIRHPTTEALCDDLGRSFRQLPASEQQREISEYLRQTEAHRAQLAAMIEDSDVGDDPFSGHPAGAAECHEQPHRRCEVTAA